MIMKLESCSRISYEEIICQHCKQHMGYGRGDLYYLFEAVCMNCWNKAEWDDDMTQYNEL